MTRDAYSHVGDDLARRWSSQLQGLTDVVARPCSRRCATRSTAAIQQLPTVSASSSPMRRARSAPASMSPRCSSRLDSSPRHTRRRRSFVLPSRGEPPCADLILRLTGSCLSSGSDRRRSPCLAGMTLGQTSRGTRHPRNVRAAAATRPSRPMSRVRFPSRSFCAVPTPARPSRLPRLRHESAGICVILLTDRAHIAYSLALRDDSRM